MTGRGVLGSGGRLAVVAAATVLVLGSCKLSLTPENVMQTYKNIQDARKDLTPENEYYIGRSVATNVLSRANYQYLDKDALQSGQLVGVTEYVNRVGQVIAAAAMEVEREGDRPAPLAGWHFVVLDDATINGVSAPGGYVFITRGAVEAAQSEDELAALLAHEVAHVIRGHAIGSIKKSRWAGVTKQALDSSVTLDQQALGSLTEVFDGAMDDMLDSLLVKGYSRDTEFEADAVGLGLMVRAGYDPRALVRYLQTLQKTQSTGSGGFSATHPKASDRIDELDERLEKFSVDTVPAARTERFTAATASLRQ